MVEGAPGNKKKIFRKKPYTTWDNYFSGEAIYEWIGKNGLSCTTICCRDWFPKDIPKQQLHLKKTDTSLRTKVARFTEPMIAAKEHKEPISNGDERILYQQAHISFQSTSSCKIATVNALNSCKSSLKARKREKNDKKRNWVIEMKDTLELYLSTYENIDNVDKLIKF